MALIGKIAIAMGVDTRALAKGLRTARADLNNFARSVTSVGLGLGAIGAIGGLAFGKIVRSASDLEEQADRTKDQFGEFSGIVIKQADLMAKAFGLAKKDTLESASVFSAIFESAGYTGESVADLSVHFVKLSTDLARFANIPVKEAMGKIQSGLVGQVRPLREVGVAMSEANIELYAIAKGIAKAGEQLTESQKIQARAGFIADALAKSWGNLAKTGDKTAGAIEAVQGRFENLSADIGGALLLGVAPALGEVQLGIRGLQLAWTETARTAIGTSDTTVAGLTAQQRSIGPLQTTIGYLADAWQVVAIAFKTAQLTITTGLYGIVGAVYKVTEGIASIQTKITGIPHQPVQGLTNLFTEMEKAVADTAAELQKMGKAPWAHEGINKGFEAARKEIEAARKELKAMGKLDVLSIKPGAAPLATGAEHKGFASAAAYGSQEAANAILGALYGQGGRNGAAERTAVNTAKTNQLLEQIARRIGGAAAGGVNGLILEGLNAF
jgi:hypothetical protein